MHVAVWENPSDIAVAELWQTDFFFFFENNLYARKYTHISPKGCRNVVFTCLYFVTTEITLVNNEPV